MLVRVFLEWEWEDVARRNEWLGRGVEAELDDEDFEVDLKEVEDLSARNVRTSMFEVAQKRQTYLSVP